MTEIIIIAISAVIVFLLGLPIVNAVHKEKERQDKYHD